jgi:hypothetical protein
MREKNIVKETEKLFFTPSIVMKSICCTLNNSLSHIVNVFMKQVIINNFIFALYTDILLKNK